MLILDMINTFDYPDGAALAGAARQVAPAIARLKRKVKANGGHCVYINDNFGRWQSDLSALVVRAEMGRGADLVARLRPDNEDIFILKPKHSGFFQTPLPLLLESLDVTRLVITGISADACVLATALDAHMRNFEVAAPSNCIASVSKARKIAAMLLLRHGNIDTRMMT
jgi:nicotinamidase-related amidase